MQDTSQLGCFAMCPDMLFHAFLVDAFKELHSKGWTILCSQFGSRRCCSLRAAASREKFTAIFNGEAEGQEHRRFHARGDSWAPSVERDIEKVRSCYANASTICNSVFMVIVSCSALCRLT